ncbi:MAG: AMP-binding protein [Sphingomonadales bacterium]|nr:AMP-binding protein [Sphingomonadaceae bacterium]MBS3932533.1 AMP-binding protein [Sphingomonadales bacterium]
MTSDVFRGHETMLHSPILLLRKAAAGGGDGFLASGTEKISYPDLDRESERFANFLIELGVAPGDRVAAFMFNSTSFIVAWFGTSKAGAIWAPVNTSYTGEWLRYQLSDSEPRVVLVDEELLATFEAKPVDLGEAVVIVRGTGGSYRRFDEYQDYSDTPNGWEPAPGDPSHLIYTSGTTGRSKGCVISHNYLCNYSRLGLQNVPRDAAETLWTPLPLFHLAGTGHLISTISIAGKGHFAPRFSLSTFWDEIEASGAKFVPTLGTAATLIATAPDCEAAARCHGQVRFLSGAASVDVQELLKERFGIQKTYVGALGQSEGGFLTTLRDLPYRPGTCGVATDSFDLRVVDEWDREIPRGEVGELVYRPKAPFVMCSGYWRNGGASADKTRNLWWHSGDFVRMDEDGYVYFADRGDDRLRKSGENVSSFELENLFSQHPAVAVPAVHAVPSELGEDEIKLTVVLRAEAKIDERALWSWASERMPRFAVPRFIEFRNDLPRNPVGKILKYQLRQDGVTKATWDARA